MSKAPTCNFESNLEPIIAGPAALEERFTISGAQGGTSEGLPPRSLRTICRLGHLSRGNSLSFPSTQNGLCLRLRPKGVTFRAQGLIYCWHTFSSLVPCR